MPTGHSNRNTAEKLDPRLLLQALKALKQGDFSVSIPLDGLKGSDKQISQTFNNIVETNRSLLGALTEIGTGVTQKEIKGKNGHRIPRSKYKGSWASYADAINALSKEVALHTTQLIRVMSAVSKGDFSQSVDIEEEGARPFRGAFARSSKAVNHMVEQLGAFGGEITRVAREVGVEGKLGAQAQVKGVSGTWKELTDTINLLVSTIAAQVRDVAQVTTAVAKGDLSRKISVDVQGEMGVLKETVNAMVERLRSFAEEVARVAEEVGTQGILGGQATVEGASGIWRELVDNVNELARNLTLQVRSIGDVVTAVTEGDLSRSIELEARGEVAALKDNVNRMIKTLDETTRANKEQDWLKTNLADFSRMLQGQRDLSETARLVMRKLPPAVGAQYGVFYAAEHQGDDLELGLFASYAYKERKNLSHRFHLKEGLVGQCAFEKQRILITDVPDDYIRISSGLGEAAPKNIIVVPILFEDEIKGVLELASFGEFSDITVVFLEELADSLGIVLATIEAQMRTVNLLEESQGLTEELRVQQEELQQANEELRVQQEELQQANEDLEEKAFLLLEQKSEMEQKNREIEESKLSLEDKAEALTVASRYKSDFLANMSHELRTPLNSMLILSKQLSENSEENLTEKQVSYASTIYDSGTDLLGLITEILDLAKIESGTVSLEKRPVNISGITEYLKESFSKTAEEEKLDYRVVIDAGTPASVTTDEKRLLQILRNLLSNAFKFTEKGSVTLAVEKVETKKHGAEDKGWSRSCAAVAFSVTDTGIGIPEEKQLSIFEAFQQADGSIGRRYGGTGLGLSISRELAELLGGTIELVSEPKKGSSFTLYLPEVHEAESPDELTVKGTLKTSARSVDKTPALKSAASAERPPAVPDDRDDIRPGDRILQIVEDDSNFAEMLMETAREKGFKCILSSEGDRAAALAKKYQPDAVTLDLRLPDTDGWVVLDQLKHDPVTRHIPVHIISGAQEDPLRGIKKGAIAFSAKPTTPEQLRAALEKTLSFLERGPRQLLVVEDDETQLKSIVELIGNNDVETTAVTDAEKAFQALRKKQFDCMVLDLRLPGMSGFELLKKIKDTPEIEMLPVIVYTGRELTQREEIELRETAESIILKGAESPERLLDETSLFLHRVEARLPETKRRMLKQAHLKDPLLSGKKVLVVDDDMRNIFALTGILERRDMTVLYAENGKDGISKLNENPDIDIVLMDIMMPDMDGYETIRSIRGQKKFKALPIIALTAKAMKGDREKCIEAGASDYIAKPPDPDRLLSLLRVWLYR